MAQKVIHNFTDNGTFVIDVGRPHNVIIGGTFGGGAVTHTMTDDPNGTPVAIRTPSTSADAYECSVWDSTFTLTGATSPDIKIVIEAI